MIRVTSWSSPPARLKVPVFLHPQNTGDINRVKDFHLWNLSAFRLKPRERHPTLAIVLAHGGGYFPYQLGRLDHAYRV